MAVTSTYDDETLLHLMVHDDRDAFEELYRRHWKKLYRSAYIRLKDHEQCKDVIQDVFTDLWLRRGKVKIENIVAYLSTAIRFQVCKLVAKGKTSSFFFEPLESIAASPYNADNSLLDKELIALAQTWLSSVPPKRQEIFRLHFIERLSTKEIANRLNISQKTVQNQLGLASQSLYKDVIHIIIWILIMQEMSE